MAGDGRSATKRLYTIYSLVMCDLQIREISLSCINLLIIVM
jgi:hypothetical protein